MLNCWKTYSIYGNMLLDASLPQGCLVYEYGRICVFELHPDFSEIPCCYVVEFGARTFLRLCYGYEMSKISSLCWSLYIVSSLWKTYPTMNEARNGYQMLIPEFQKWIPNADTWISKVGAFHDQELVATVSEQGGCETNKHCPCRFPMPPSPVSYRSTLPFL